jgi:exopolysaccharide biosynthesis polyprenyl glycosylphosphotransferase
LTADNTSTAEMRSVATLLGRGRPLGSQVRSSQRTRGRARWIRTTLAGCDALVLVVVALALRLAGSHPTQDSASLPIALVIPVVLWLAAYQAFGLYGATRVSPRYEARAVIGATATGTILVSLTAERWGGPATTTAVVSMFAFALGLELVGRWAVRSLVARSTARGRLVQRTLVVGSDEESRKLEHRLSSSPIFEPVGVVTASPQPWSDDGAPLKRIEDVGDTIRELSVDCVFIAGGSLSADDVLAISRACRGADVEIRISVDTSAIRTSRLSIESIDGIASVAVRPIRFTKTQAVLKRCIDLAVGSIVSVFVLPLVAMVGIAIKASSPGPILFRQARVTKGGRVFTMYKFRTMVIDPERALEGKVIDLSQPFFKMENDPRLTTVGRLLRSFSIDELPQLWNVLRGDMSLVGPRPLPLDQVTANLEFLSPRHEVRAGLTGLWQISGRSDLDSAEALEIDRFYIDNWSLSFDAFILCKTVGAVLTRKGAL